MGHRGAVGHNSWLWGLYSRFLIKVTCLWSKQPVAVTASLTPHEFVIRAACPQRTSARNWRLQVCLCPATRTTGSPSTRVPPSALPASGQAMGPECLQRLHRPCLRPSRHGSVSPFQDLPMPGPGWLGVSSQTSSPGPA